MRLRERVRTEYGWLEKILLSLIEDQLFLIKLKRAGEKIKTAGTQFDPEVVETFPNQKFQII